MVFKWFQSDQWNTNSINFRLFSLWIISSLDNTHQFAVKNVPNNHGTVLRCFQLQVANVIKHKHLTISYKNKSDWKSLWLFSGLMMSSVVQVLSEFLSCHF